MVQENPRFTNLLRSVLPSHQHELPSPADLERLLAEREAQPPPPPPGSSADDIVEDGEEMLLTFNQFVAQSTAGNEPTSGKGEVVTTSSVMSL
jgi:hypothetical protein